MCVNSQRISPFAVMWRTTALPGMPRGGGVILPDRVVQPGFRGQLDFAGSKSPSDTETSDLLNDRDVFVAWDRHGQTVSERETLKTQFGSRSDSVHALAKNKVDIEPGVLTRRSVSPPNW